LGGVGLSGNALGAWWSRGAAKADEARAAAAARAARPGEPDIAPPRTPKPDDPDFVGPPAPAKQYSATLGKATSTDYKKTFFNAHPELEGNVVVHHAIEQQVLKKYPGVISEAELHSLENLRGIPKEINSDVHLSKIRKEWNRFYEGFDLTGTAPTRQQLLDKATAIDKQFGKQFKPPVGG
jgi:hypothetical protein